MEFTSRLATLEDVPRLTAVMDVAIAELQRAFLDDEQIEASRAVMGIDTQPIEDGTYFVVETPDGDVAGCGGWSRRGTMYGNDLSSSTFVSQFSGQPLRLATDYSHSETRSKPSSEQHLSAQVCERGGFLRWRR